MHDDQCYIVELLMIVSHPFREVDRDGIVYPLCGLERRFLDCLDEAVDSEHEPVLLVRIPRFGDSIRVKDDDISFFDLNLDLPDDSGNILGHSEGDSS